MSMLRAAADAGIDRGVHHFERVVYASRMGRNYVAVPAGPVDVKMVDEVGLLRSADWWLARARRTPSSSVASSVARVDRCAADVARGASTPQSLERWLLALADAELAVAKRPASRATTEPTHIRPLAGLDPGIATSLPDSTEVRLARALAAVGRQKDRSGLRQLLEPVVTRDRWRYAWSEDARLGPPVELPIDLLIELATRSSEEIDDVSAAHCARLADVSAFIDGATDDRALVHLAFALTFCPPTRQLHNRSSLRGAPTDRLYAVTRLASGRAARRPGGVEVDVGPAPHVVAALRSGHARRAARAAAGRLRADALVPYASLDQIGRDPARSRRIAAALAFPLHPSDRAHLERAVLTPVEAASTEEGETR
jgi:CRISPR-associated protein Csx17